MDNVVINMPDTVQYGSTGAAATLAQKCLKNAGWYTGRIDGNFGYYSTLALKYFQKATGHTPDGICGPKTWPDLLKYQPVSTAPVVVAPIVSGLHHGCHPPQTLQPNNWTCGIATATMAAACYGLSPGWNWLINISGANPTNGTGHTGMKAIFNNLGPFNIIDEPFNKNGWSGVANNYDKGYNLLINYMTGPLPGWRGNWPHWSFAVGVDDNNIYVECPEHGYQTFPKSKMELAFAAQPNNSLFWIYK